MKLPVGFQEIHFTSDINRQYRRFIKRTLMLVKDKSIQVQDYKTWGEIN